MLPIYSGYLDNLGMLKLPAGKCIIVEYGDEFTVITSDDKYSLFMYNGKYNFKNQYYNSAEEFIKHKNLECVPVKMRSVKVEKTYGDMDTVCLVSVVAPDSTWILTRVYESADYGESEDEINLYGAEGDWVPTNQFVKFNTKEMLDNQIRLLDDLGMLDH